MFHNVSLGGQQFGLQRSHKTLEKYFVLMTDAFLFPNFALFSLYRAASWLDIGWTIYFVVMWEAMYWDPVLAVWTLGFFSPTLAPPAVILGCLFNLGEPCCAVFLQCHSILRSPFPTAALPCVCWQGIESHVTLKQHNVGIPLLFFSVNRSWTINANLQNDSFKFTLVLHYFIIKF